MLNKDEIIRRLEKGTLLIGARRNNDGHFDVEPDSYDLTAGVAIWKEELQQNKYEIKTIMCANSCPVEQQPTITVQPGQMIFVITREEVDLPLEICGTVYSRNNIALEGILALNAGHVDPGYKGPIVIRLINLKATPWTLHLGNPIFTITFQAVDHVEGDKLESGPIYPFEKMLDRVRKTAENSLSNALFDLYVRFPKQNGRLSGQKSHPAEPKRPPSPGGEENSLEKRGRRWVNQSLRIMLKRGDSNGKQEVTHAQSQRSPTFKI